MNNGNLRYNITQESEGMVNESGKGVAYDVNGSKNLPGRGIIRTGKLRNDSIENKRSEKVLKEHFYNYTSNPYSIGEGRNSEYLRHNKTQESEGMGKESGKGIVDDGNGSKNKLDEGIISTENAHKDSIENTTAGKTLREGHLYNDTSTLHSVNEGKNIENLRYNKTQDPKSMRKEFEIDKENKENKSKNLTDGNILKDGNIYNDTIFSTTVVKPLEIDSIGSDKNDNTGDEIPNDENENIHSETGRTGKEIKHFEDLASETLASILYNDSESEVKTDKRILSAATDTTGRMHQLKEFR
ncbi:hypothetical protein CEXT_236191 [Caerostris extrusa]|uniref:Uncharacterized protein n=1 Tax=Caerostris extrusa TaxID=172846 RepID=A0AAV4SHT3_CAEEX|nr:hypothetical protein CEXT_236191 [Caerostris extrusa]